MLSSITERFSVDEKIKTFFIVSLSWLMCLSLFWFSLKLFFRQTKGSGNVIQ
jgi:hypothetical protein